MKEVEIVSLKWKKMLRVLAARIRRAGGYYEPSFFSTSSSAADLRQLFSTPDFLFLWKYAAGDDDDAWSRELEGWKGDHENEFKLLYYLCIHTVLGSNIGNIYIYIHLTRMMEIE